MYVGETTAIAHPIATASNSLLSDPHCYHLLFLHTTLYLSMI
jgi:hypothetical protein